MKQILEHFQIADYFTAIVGSELDGRRTDKAEVIEEALRRMHLEEERDKVLMVGDRSHDVQGLSVVGFSVSVSHTDTETVKNWNLQVLFILQTAWKIWGFWQVRMTKRRQKR